METLLREATPSSIFAFSIVVNPLSEKFARRGDNFLREVPLLERFGLYGGKQEVTKVGTLCKMTNM